MRSKNPLGSTRVIVMDKYEKRRFYAQRKAEEEEAKEKYINEFKEKTEELRYKNEQAKLARERRTLWNQTHDISHRRLF